MRPPLTSTPPISHMIPQNLNRRQSRDWSCLTSDSSIQIIHLSSADHTFDEHMMSSGSNHNDVICTADDVNCYNGINTNVTNTLDLVETIRVTSPDQTHLMTPNIHPGPDPCDVQIMQTETLVALDSIKHSSGCTLDARLVFARGKDVFVSENDLLVEKIYSSGSETEKTLTRNMYSDSDMLNGRLPKYSDGVKVANLIRSKSLGYHEHRKRQQERGLLRPLQPIQTNKSKVGNVKRLPCVAESFRMKATAKQCKSDEKKNITQTKIPIRHTESLRIPTTVDASKSKIAKFVKTGLKTIIKSKDSFSINTESKRTTPKLQTTKERKIRRTRVASDLGGLSEFLRRNERRKTVALFPELRSLAMGDACTAPDVIVEEPESGSSKLSTHVKEGRSDLKYTPKPWTGTLSFVTNKPNSKGVGNLQFASCHRKLVFPASKFTENHEDASTESPHTTQVSTMTASDEVVENRLRHYELKHVDNGVRKDMFDCFKINKNPEAQTEKVTPDDKEQASKRPRLGVLGLSKPVSVVPIDDLEMDIVRDLKRRMNKANKVSNIKTNGSLKTRPKLGQIHKPVFTPRKPVLARSSRLMPTNTFLQQGRTKRESFV